MPDKQLILSQRICAVSLSPQDAGVPKNVWERSIGVQRLIFSVNRLFQRGKYAT
jgi:hypothetical protein